MKYLNIKYSHFPILLVVGLSFSCINAKSRDTEERTVSVDGVHISKTDTLLVATIDDNTLVITAAEESRQLRYFLLDTKHLVLDSLEFTTYREAILDRKIYDWDGDSSQDLVEIRKHRGQMFSSITDVVYSVVGNKFERVFCMITHELDCSTPNEDDYGIIVRREYEQIGSNVFRVSEVEGYVKCVEDLDIPDNAKPLKIIGRKQYEATSDELLNIYGEQYDR